MFRTLSRWLPTKPRKMPATCVRKALGLESLEAREVPAAHIWTGPASGGFWNNAANWTGGIPTTGELGGTTVTFNSAVVSTQNVPGLEVGEITFNHTGSTIHLAANLGLDGSSGIQIQDTTGGNTIDSTSGVLLLTGSADPFIQVITGTLTIKADIVGTRGLDKTGGPGTLELDGAASYNGATRIDDGVLALNNGAVDQALPNNQIIVGDNIGLSGSAELRLLDSSEIPDAASITINVDGKFNLNGELEGINGMTLHGGSVETANGVLILNGDINVTKAAAINTGVTSGGISLAAGNHTITVASGENLTITAQLGGAGGIVKDGQGTLQYQNPSLSAHPNNYTGTTTVNDGGLILNDIAPDSAFQGNLVIGDGVGLPGTAFVQLDAQDEIPNTKTVSIDFDGELNLNGHVETIGSLSINGGGSVQNTSPGKLTLNGDITMPFSVNLPAHINSNIDLGSSIWSITVDNPNLGLIIDGQITGTGGFFKEGVGTLELQGSAGAPNTYSGQTRIEDGTLVLNHDSTAAVSASLGVFPSGGNTATLRLMQNSEIPDTASVTITDGGVLDLNGFNDTIGNLTMRTDSSITTGLGTLTLNGNVIMDPGSLAIPATITGNLALGAVNRTFTVNGILPGGEPVIAATISGFGGLVKAGSGMLTLNGNNIYSGPTNVTDGTLRVNGVQTGSAVNLSFGILGGTGHVGVLTGTGGQVAPGASPGTLTTQDLHLGGSTYVAELNGVAAGQYDQIQVVGTANVTGSTLTPVVNFASKFGDSFKIIDNNNNDAVVGTFTGLAEGGTIVAGGRTFQITYKGGDGNDVVLTDHSPDSYAVGAGDGGSSSVQVFNADGSAKATVQAFDNSFTGGVRTASGDVTGDGVADLIAGTGPGVPAEVRIYDGVTNQIVQTIPVFEGFTGGVYVTTGDFNHDGHSDIVVTPDIGGGPRVTVFSGLDGSVMSNFFGITDANFRGGARTAVGDMNGDGTPDVYVAAGFGGGPRVTAFDGTTLVGGNPTKLFNDIFVFDAGLRNGVYLAAGDIDGDGKADLIAGAGPGGGPRVYALSGADLMNGMANGSTQLANFFGGNPDNRAGIRVVAKNLDGDSQADLIVGDGEGAGSQVTSYLGKNVMSSGTPAVDGQFNAYPGFMGGVFVG